MSVCLSVCNTTTFESIDLESSFSVCRYILKVYGSCSYMKVIGLRSKSQEQKARNSYDSHNVKLMGNKSGSVEGRAVKCACSVGFSVMAIAIFVT